LSSVASLVVAIINRMHTTSSFAYSKDKKRNTRFTKKVVMGQARSLEISQMAKRILLVFCTR